MPSIGLPQDKDFMGPRLIFSKPLLQVGYALALPKSLTVASLDDLSGRRVAVQIATTPQSLLADRDDIQTVTFREPEEAMAALAAGQVDAAFIWGPIAGYVNKHRARQRLSHRTGDRPRPAVAGRDRLRTRADELSARRSIR